MATTFKAKKPTFLYVEDEDGPFRRFQQTVLQLWPDAQVLRVEDFSATRVIDTLKRCESDGRPVDVILLDLRYEERDPIDRAVEEWSGLRLLKELRTRESPAQRLPIVACTLYSERHPRMRDRSPGVVFLLHGGTDFFDKMELEKDPDIVSWHLRLHNHVAISRRLNLRQAALNVPAIRGTLEGGGRFIEELRGKLRHFVDNGTRFLCLYGETGVGKGSAVGFIKQCLGLGDVETAEVQILTIPEPLLESYLFGHRKGAFTGATANRPGALEGKKVIYLDEFQRIPLHIQAKLLRVLRERYFHRVGETERREIDAGAVFVVSLDAPPEVLVRRGVLSRDIAGRLPLSLLEMRPLRARKDEIEHLVLVFLERRRKRGGGTVPAPMLGIDPDAARLIATSTFDWPYNIGQLEAFVEHLCDTRTSNVITCADVRRALQSLMGNELELALGVLRRYAFDRSLAALAWASMGKPGTTYLRDDRNMNTFCVRRVLCRVAADVAEHERDYQATLLEQLLGPERFDPMLQDIVRKELRDLQERLTEAVDVVFLSELTRTAPLRPWTALLARRKELPRERPASKSDSAAELGSLLNYKTVPEDLLPGIGLLLVLELV